MCCVRVTTRAKSETRRLPLGREGLKGHIFPPLSFHLRPAHRNTTVVENERNVSPTFCPFRQLRVQLYALSAHYEVGFLIKAAAASATSPNNTWTRPPRTRRAVPGCPPRFFHFHPASPVGLSYSLSFSPQRSPLLSAPVSFRQHDELFSSLLSLFQQRDGSIRLLVDDEYGMFVCSLVGVEQMKHGYVRLSMSINIIAQQRSILEAMMAMV